MPVDYLEPFERKATVWALDVIEPGLAQNRVAWEAAQATGEISFGARLVLNEDPGKPFSSLVFKALFHTNKGKSSATLPDRYCFKQDKGAPSRIAANAWKCDGGPAGAVVAVYEHQNVIEAAVRVFGKELQDIDIYLFDGKFDTYEVLFFVKVEMRRLET